MSITKLFTFFFFHCSNDSKNSTITNLKKNSIYKNDSFIYHTFLSTVL